jgi:hypothetical protein
MRRWIERLSEHAKSHTSVLNAIKDAMDPEKEDFGITDRMAPRLVDMILDENNESRKEMLLHQVLQSLRFEDMPTRYETIPEAYRATFECVFNEEYRPVALSAANDLITSSDSSLSVDTFAAWLKSDQKLYWVTGKPGAGKSTLMKFMSNHRSLKRISKAWTERDDSRSFSDHIDSAIELWDGEYPYPEQGRRQFRVGAYFFWNPGSPMQKTKRGLCQTLLYQLLEQDIERVSDIFPKR